MRKLNLKNFTEKVNILALPMYEVGEVVKLSEGVREARKTSVSYVLTKERDNRICEMCEGCFFDKTSCGEYISVRCTKVERKEDSVVFTPCTKTGEPI